MRIFNSLLMLTLLTVTCFASDSGTKSDAERINDIYQIAEVLEAYKQSNGEYPFSENWSDVEEGMTAVPIFCELSIHKLPKSKRYPPPGVSGYMMEAAEFESYLSAGLNKNIKLPKDDKVINSTPLSYSFLFNGKDYFIAVYLTQHHPDARKISTNWYKYEIGSIAVPERKIKKYKSFFNIGNE